MTTITNNMTSADYISAINANFTELCTNNSINIACMTTITSLMSVSDFIKAINHNFRALVITEGMNGDAIISNLNKYFLLPIKRFQDNKITNIFPNGEPCALVSDDGNTMDIWTNSGWSYTTDGVNYSAPVRCTFDGFSGVMCVQVMKDGTTYYATGVRNDFHTLELWSSSNKYTWTHIKTIFTTGVSGAWTRNAFGNSFMWKENGTWKMIYEVAAPEAPVAPGWCIGYATCTTVDGIWVDYASNPIISNGGNPELACVDNKVYKFNGLYWLYYHVQDNYGTTKPVIKRAYSNDCINWTDEGVIVDSREAPIDVHWTNGDQCVCQFKGKTYLFYTNNANGGGANIHTDVTVDNRPLYKILSMYP